MEGLPMSIELIKLLIQGVGVAFLIGIAFSAGKVKEQLKRIEIDLREGVAKFTNLELKLNQHETDIAVLKISTDQINMKIPIIILFIFLTSALNAQTWTHEMDSLARVTESDYDLPHGICRAFALQESNYNPYAVRAEGNYINAGGTYASNIRKQSIVFARNHNYAPSILTEVVQRGQSWTMWQIMGQNLRDLGFDSPFFAGEMTIDDQFEYFAAFIGKLLKKHNGKIDYAASEYNGGFGAIRKGNFRNAGYVKNILKYQKQFSY